ncbi:unnamed protein product [Adineta steineri]|uniref:Uncharacterized protein n=1 Tax=Adineta steineri TaxID=433720 RepID=A0A819YGN0_9BILA|nr:unnamed protein product [Adineta steineri]CAF0985173.1 unnamed protein product [Adineta steineri]CAF3929727.1 unnamed protein product [Adineta steineri]CAF4152913.1 unnamed protein product [Adineta steineri]
MTDIEEVSRKKREYTTAFLNVSQEEAELLLGFKIYQFYNDQLPIEQFITKTAPEELKKKIFDRLTDCMNSEGFPEATIAPINESVVTDYVGLILMAMVAYSNRTTHRNELMLLREKQIISKDEQYGENIEFVTTQMVHVRNTRYILVVEAKRDSLGKGLIQLLLALKSMSDINNDQKMVYGFVTTAINWQLITYDGQLWKLSEPAVALLGNMGTKEDRWLKQNTQILDVIFTVLSSI